MATVRDKLLPVFAKLRGIADQPFGLRQYRVLLRTRTPSDSRGGRGSTDTVVDVELTEKPRVRSATTDDVAASGGLIQIADWIMDRITPQNEAATVGIAPGTVARMPLTANQQVLVVLVGPEMPAYTAASAGPPAVPPSGGGEFTVVASHEDANFGYRYVLRPKTGAR